jgi:hypothetical protein
MSGLDVVTLEKDGQPNGCIQRPDTWLLPNASQKVRLCMFDETISAGAASHHNAAERRKTGLTVARTAVERRGQGALMLYRSTHGLSWMTRTGSILEITLAPYT